MIWYFYRVMGGNKFVDTIAKYMHQVDKKNDLRIDKD